MKNRRAGTSLLEVLIASAILVIVVAITMAILSSGTSTAQTGRLQSELEQRGSRTLAFLRDQLSVAAFTQPGNLTATPPGTQPAYARLGMIPWSAGSGNLAVGYQIPGQTSVPATGKMSMTGVSFGYPDPFSKVIDPTATNISQPVKNTYACFIRFEADTVYMEGPNAPIPTQVANWTDPALPAYPALVEASGQSNIVVKVLNMNIHGDQTQNNTYVSGKLMKYIVDETQSTSATTCVVSRERLDDQVVMRVNSTAPGDWSGSMDRTLGTHYLFAYCDATGTPVPAMGTLGPGLNFGSLPPNATAGIKVDLWHGCLDQNGKRFILRNNTIFIRFRTELFKES